MKISIQEQRVALNAGVATARAAFEREAYIEATGGKADVKGARAEVERLEAALTHLEAVEKGQRAAAAEEREREEAAKRADLAKSANKAREKMLATAAIVDRHLDDLASAWRELLEANEGHFDAVVSLVYDFERQGNTMTLHGHFDDLIANRASAILARKGMKLPNWSDVARQADVIEGYPEHGLKTVAEVVENRVKALRLKASADELD